MRSVRYEWKIMLCILKSYYISGKKIIKQPMSASASLWLNSNFQISVRKGLFPKCANLCEVIPPLPSGGWGAARACWFRIPVPCRVESCSLILQITMAICHLKVLKESSFKSNKFNLLISMNQLKKNKLVSINEFLLPVRYWTLLVCQLNCKNQQLCHKSSFNYICRVPFLLEESIFLKNDLLFKA